jgi:ABC-2 type transport system permease protein
MVLEALAEIVRFKDLLWNLVKRDLVVRYKRSVLGFFWSILNPVINTIVYTVVFSTIFRFDAEDYVIYFLTGYLVWNFFSQSTALSTRSILDNVGLFSKVYIPKTIFVLSVLLSGLINLGFTLVPLLALMVIMGKHFTFAILFVPVALTFATLFTLGVSLFLASVTVFFHDVGETYRVLLLPWMFLTPIVYPVSIIPDRYLPIVRANPWNSLVECIRAPLYYGVFPDWHSVAYAGFVSLAACVIGWKVFSALSDKFVYYA